MDWDVIESPIFYNRPVEGPFGEVTPQYLEDPEYKRLIATDDGKPVGPPYAPSYTPSSVAKFWEVINKGMGDTPYKIVSAGSVDDRCKIFASIQTTEGFMVGDREFKDYVTILDSFDKSCSLTALYSNVCVVCANTFASALQSGKVVGKAKHTLMLDVNIQRLIDAIDSFVGTSAYFKQLLQRAHETPCTRDEAHAWFTGLECRNAEHLTNGIRQKTARMAELFSGGRGNEGRTRLDAFSGLTEFYTRESSRSSDNQSYSSEFGTAAQTKRFVVDNFEKTWDKFRKEGEALLSA